MDIHVRARVGAVVGAALLTCGAVRRERVGRAAVARASCCTSRTSTRTRATTGSATTRAPSSRGSKLFHSVSGDWTVPTATQHAAGKSASSSDWIGIGRGLRRRDLLRHR